MRLLVALVLMSAGGVTALLRMLSLHRPDKGGHESGMTAAMSAGMMVGLGVGVGAGILSPSDLWPPTVIGTVAGIAAGMAVGLPYGLMVLLEGVMAGVMGGTMGAMMGGMMPGRATPLAVASLLLTIAVGGLCARLLLQGHGTGGGHEHHGHHAMPWGRIWGLTGGVAAVVGMAGWFAVGPYIHRQQVGVASQHIHPVTITLTARDLQFEPAVVEVPVGRPVRLKLVNEGQQDHDLNIPDLPYRRSDRADLRAEPLGFHLFAGPGEDAALEFIALREGEYKAYCSVPGHREAGMQVLLRVTDAK